MQDYLESIRHDIFLIADIQLVGRRLRSFRARCDCYDYSQNGHEFEKITDLVHIE